MCNIDQCKFVIIRDPGLHRLVKEEPLKCTWQNLSDQCSIDPPDYTGETSQSKRRKQLQLQLRKLEDCNRAWATYCRWR